MPNPTLTDVLTAVTAAAAQLQALQTSVSQLQADDAADASQLTALHTSVSQLLTDDAASGSQLSALQTSMSQVLADDAAAGSQLSALHTSLTQLLADDTADAAQLQSLITEVLELITPIPTVTSVTPTHGGAAGGTSVVITGTGFTAVTAVNFGTVAAASFTIDSDTQITAVTAAGAAGIVDVAVTNWVSKTSAATSADQYTMEGISISSFTPGTGTTSGGTSVTISGIGFSAVTVVNFGGTNGFNEPFVLPGISFTADSDTQITAITPAAPVPDPANFAPYYPTRWGFTLATSAGPVPGGFYTGGAFIYTA